ncbi:hypothetical protein JCM6882_007879 [Rhodosporidiobolus microsporus]
MADNAPAARSSPFDKLPLELLKRIVELVKEQDAAFDRNPTVTLKQLASSTFRFKLVYQPGIISSIRTLDVSKEQGGDWVTAASLFPRLSFARLLVARFSLAVVPPEDFQTAVSEDTHDAALAWEAFQDVVRQVTVVGASDLQLDQLERLLLLLPRSNIRQMGILYHDIDLDDDAFTFGRAHSRLLPLFSQLVKLETLELHDEGTWDRDYTVDPSWRALSLPSLSAVTIRGQRRPFSLCELVKTAAPDLRALSVDQVYGGKCLTLPHFLYLRHFSIETAATSTASFVIPPTTPLLSLAVRACGSLVTCRSKFPDLEDLPPSLRLITLHVTSTSAPDDAEAFRAECAAQGITFRLIWSPDATQMEQALVETHYGAVLPPHNRQLDPAGLAAARETLEWANGRLDWCERFGDVQTGQEIITALTRVRERQAIEMQ